MGIIRGTVWIDREVVPKVIEFDGTGPFIEKQDGTWFNPETGNACVQLTLQEFLEDLEE